jgi:hypothetical protein
MNAQLTDLISERRRRQENPDRTAAIFRIFIDPVTKKESTVSRRLASVIGGPNRLQQEPEETNDANQSEGCRGSVEKQNAQMN